MSEENKQGPHVYQPFSKLDALHWPDRIFGVAGLPLPAFVRISGLTRDEAEVVVRALTELYAGQAPPADTDGD